MLLGEPRGFACWSHRITLISELKRDFRDWLGVFPTWFVWFGFRNKKNFFFACRQFSPREETKTIV